MGTTCLGIRHYGIVHILVEIMLLCSKLRHETKANRQKQSQVNNENRGGRSFGLAARIVTVERSGWVEQKD